MRSCSPHYCGSSVLHQSAAGHAETCGLVCWTPERPGPLPVQCPPASCASRDPCTLERGSSLPHTPPYLRCMALSGGMLQQPNSVTSKLYTVMSFCILVCIPPDVLLCLHRLPVCAVNVLAQHLETGRVRNKVSCDAECKLLMHYTAF